MLRVKTKLGKSEKDGIGLFADEFIKAGTVTWLYDPEFDIAFDEKVINHMSEYARKQFVKYAYFDHDLKKYVLCSDDQRFINHSKYSQHSFISQTGHRRTGHSAGRRDALRLRSF